MCNLLCKREFPKTHTPLPPLKKGVPQNTHPLPPLKKGGSPKHTPLTTLAKGWFPKTHTPYHPSSPAPPGPFFLLQAQLCADSHCPKKPNSLALRYCDTQPSTTVTTVINRAVVPAETTTTCTPFSKGSPLFKGRISW